MTDTNLDFEINSYKQSLPDFIKQAHIFNENSSQYRGYEQLKDLIDSSDFSKHDLYQITHGKELAGLAAVIQVGEILYFDIFVVDPEFREIGIGDELFEYVINQNKYSDAKFYESKALPGDRHTKNFFETRKGKARLLIVRGEL